MSFGLQIFDSSGTLVWDSTTVVGGVVADVQTVAIGATGTWTYPAYAGRTPFLIPLVDDIPATISVDTTLGYPRVIATSSPIARRFMLAVT